MSLRSRAARDDGGSVVVEVVLLAVVVMVPLAYGVLALFEVQRAAFAVSSAAREAGRAFVTAPSGAAASRRAEAAADLALADHGVPGATRVRVRCAASPCLTPGARVTVVVRARVRLPFVPRIAGAAPATVAVRARHVVVVDEFVERRP